MTVEHRLLTMRLTVLVDKVKYKVLFFLGAKLLPLCTYFAGSYNSARLSSHARRTQAQAFVTFRRTSRLRNSSKHAAYYRVHLPVGTPFEWFRKRRGDTVYVAVHGTTELWY